MKLKRTERIGVIVTVLTEHPNKVFNLNYFTQKLSVAKSTISEDLMIVKNVFKKMRLGKIVTISGASGGVKFVPIVDREEAIEFLDTLCQRILSENRLLPGGFLYLVDIIYNPDISSALGKLFASVIDYSGADYVVTMETKGIPVALMTAKAMNLPLVIIRKNTKISEGSSLGITYVSGTSGAVQTMSLPRKSLREGSKVIIIDDFMRGGGTLKGMQDLMQEFNAEVVAAGVLISTKMPKEKMVAEYISLLELNETLEEKFILPSTALLDKMQW